MKNITVFILIILFSISVIAQTSQTTPRNPKKPASAKNLANEKEEFDKAVALTDTTERIAALRKFVEDFPKSKEKNRASELITSARAALADEKFRSGAKAESIELFELAVRETPKPVSDKLYTEIILQIPNSLFFRGERAAANDIAGLIEEKADGNAQQMLALAAFHIGLENVAEAKRLADKAISLEPNLPAAYQTLGVAHRLDFQFEESVSAYTKALELGANSTISKRSLAEMKRATGKPAEAVALYREILAKDAADGAAQNGLILALFDAENKIEAEAELAKSLEANPNNLFLLVGAAYWYAAREQGAKAIELAEKAVALEPRYTWARIALARGLIQQKRPFDAEKALLAARQYGDFPTLDYELATARFHAGFYREAAETLQKKFSVKDNLITTRLGGRVARDGKTFTELLAAERRASIFQTQAADNSEIADKLNRCSILSKI
jgi:tetratricopeptide (TPR) repeat protein